MSVFAGYVQNMITLFISRGGNRTRKETAETRTGLRESEPSVEL